MATFQTHNRTNHLQTVYFTIYELVTQLSHFVKLQIEMIVDVLFLPD